MTVYKITVPIFFKTIFQKAFANCSDLTDVYCFTEDVPCMKDGNKTCTDAFEGSYIEYATLHVLEGSINSYKVEEPWKNFKEIVKITSMFTLTYIVDGEMYKTYQVEEGANITPEAVFAKEGYSFSGWSEIPQTMPAHDVTVIGTFYKKGDANGDSIVNAADIVEVVNYILGNPSEKFNYAAANVNNDNVVNSEDIEQIVNIVMESE